MVTDTDVCIKPLLRRYQSWLKKNRGWLFKDAPTRKDLRIFEAVYHFNLYRCLSDIFSRKQGRVFPEFPTGNGKIDLIVHYKNRTYGIEVKTYTDETGYKAALNPAASYGQQLKLSEITLVFFVEYVDETNRQKYEKDYLDAETGMKVVPVFVETGN